CAHPRRLVVVHPTGSADRRPGLFAVTDQLRRGRSHQPQTPHHPQSGPPHRRPQEAPEGARMTTADTPEQGPVLTARNVSINYQLHPVVHAVRDVSLTLYRGEILGLAGE